MLHAPSIRRCASVIVEHAIVRDRRRPHGVVPAEEPGPIRRVLTIGHGVWVPAFAGTTSWGHRRPGTIVYFAIMLYPASGRTGAPSARSFSTIRSHDIQNPKVRASVESPRALGLVGAWTVMVSQKLPLPRIGNRTRVSA